MGSVRWKREWRVLFTGDLDNNFVAIDAAAGKILYSLNTGGSVGGDVISYEVAGKQYAAAMSGAVSGFLGRSGPAALIV
jgi:alcohol dehydrogenase (cytochrome c)